MPPRLARRQRAICQCRSLRLGIRQSASRDAVGAHRICRGRDDRADVYVAVPAGGGYVRYRYRRDAAARTVTVELTGNGADATLCLPPPPGVRPESMVIAVNGVARHDIAATAEGIAVPLPSLAPTTVTLAWS